jgi:hypothetical protein
MMQITRVVIIISIFPVVRSTDSSLAEARCQVQSNEKSKFIVDFQPFFRSRKHHAVLEHACAVYVLLYV